MVQTLTTELSEGVPAEHYDHTDPSTHTPTTHHPMPTSRPTSHRTQPGLPAPGTPAPRTQLACADCPEIHRTHFLRGPTNPQQAVHPQDSPTQPHRPTLGNDGKRGRHRSPTRTHGRTFQSPGMAEVRHSAPYLPYTNTPTNFYLYHTMTQLLPLLSASNKPDQTANPRSGGAKIGDALDATELAT